MKSSSVEILLIFPPSFEVYQPYLALPALTAFLRSKGFDSFQQWDCNIEAFWYFLETESLQRAINQVERRRESFESRFSELSTSERQEYYRLSEAGLASEIVLKNLDQAKDYFNQKRPSSIGEYYLHIRTLSKALGIISAAYYPSEVSLHDFRMRFSCQHSEDIFRAVSSPENPYIEYYTRRVLPRFLELKPTLIGVSVACMSQIIPSFTFAKIVRESLPTAKIVFGGQVFNRLVDNVLRLPRLFDLVDYFIIREGETALLQLTKYLEGKIGIEEVPNLVYFDFDKRRAVKSAKVYVEDVARLPIPDFSDLDLSQYLSHTPVLPYQIVRGCYWNRCAFCNHFAVHPPGERAKSPRQVVNELRKLRETWQTPYFTLVNESVRPQLLRAYAEAISDAHLDVEWYVGARLEPTLDTETLSVLEAGGCRKIYFGLETGSQRVLDSMRKGVSLANARRILQDCGELDIAVHLFLMLGFPTEKLEDLRVSEEVVSDLARLVPPHTFTYYISVFQLKPCSSVFDNPERFDIVSVRRAEDGKDLEYLYEFQAVNREEAIDYEAERLKLEVMLDKIKGSPIYPENVVHFLTMRAMFTRVNNLGHQYAGEGLSDQTEQILKLREGLAFAKIKSYDFDNGVAVDVYLVYDYLADEMFIVRSPILWNVARRLSVRFDKSGLYEEIKTELREENHEENLAETIAGTLLESRIVVPAGELIESGGP